MVIRHIYMEQFGAMREKKISFTPGLNIIEGENESGKTTAAAFLCFLLYGILTPQMLDAPAVGFAELSCTEFPVLPEGAKTPTGKTYRLERAAGERPFCALYEVNESGEVAVCLYHASGEEIRRTGEPGEWFFGVPAHVFSASAYVTQIAPASRAENGGAVTSGEAVMAAIERMLYAADESLDVQGAILRLDQKRRELYDDETGGGMITALENKHKALLRAADADAALSMQGQENNREENAVSRATLTDVSASLSSEDMEARSALDAEIKACNAKLKQQEARMEKLRALHERYRQYAALDDAATLPPLVARAKAAQNRIAALEETMFRGTYIPDEAYAESLHVCAKELSSAEAALAEIGEEEKKLAFSASRDNLKESRMRRVALDGGAEVIGDKLEKIRGKRTAVTVFGVLFLFFTVIALATVMVLIMLHATGTKNSILVMAVLAALAGFFFFMRGQYGRTVGVMLTRYSCITEDELENFLEEFSLSESKLRMLDKNKEALAIRQSEASLRATEAKRRAALLLSKLQPAEKPPLSAERLRTALIEEAACRIDQTLAQIKEEARIASESQNAIMEILRRHSASSVAALLEKRSALASAIGFAESEGTSSADADALTRELSAHAKEYAKTKEHYAALLTRRSAYGEARAASAAMRGTAGGECIGAGQNAAHRCLPDPALSAALLSETEGTLRKLRRDYAAYTRAYETLVGTSEALHAQIAPRLTKSAGRMLRILTGERFDEITLDAEMSMTAAHVKSTDGDDGGETLSLHRMSAGTQELAYLSLRMALTGMLYKKEIPPLIFDEAFATLDDRRLARMIALLLRGTSDIDRQALIFTCHKRERRAADAIGKCNVVRLSSARQ